MRRRLGQHFLKNEAVLEKIATAVHPHRGEVVVEIGPGHGELTKYLVAGDARVVVLERDLVLADALEADKQFSSVEVVRGDALETFPALSARLEKEKTPYVLIGNIPYYITGHLLRVLGDAEYKPARTVLLIQKEVAQRICAGSPRMNLLAAAVQAWAVPKILLSVPRGSFAPPPEVDSAVVTVETRQTALPHKKLHAYFLFIRALFKHPRKTILNNLSESTSILREEIVRRCNQIGIDPLGRPQVLLGEEIMRLFGLFGGDL